MNKAAISEAQGQGSGFVLETKGTNCRPAAMLSLVAVLVLREVGTTDRQWDMDALRGQVHIIAAGKTARDR
jgi:hypothetical protein